MEESTSRRKKSVTFGKVYVRILLNCDEKDDDGPEKLAENRSGVERIQKNEYEDSNDEIDLRGRFEENAMGGKRKPVKDNNGERVKIAKIKTKSILKKTSNTSHETNEARAESDSIVHKSGRKRLVKVKGRSTRASEVKFGKIGNISAVEKYKVKSKKMDGNIKVNSSIRETENRAFQVEKEQIKSPKTFVNGEQKQGNADEAKRGNRLMRSERKVLNFREQKTPKKDINPKTSEETVDFNRNKSLKPDIPDKPENGQTKDTEKWPRLEFLDAMKGMVDNTGVYSGIEADRREIMESLSKIGVDVGEDKLQTPSEFIAVMSQLLGLGNTESSKYKTSSDTFTPVTKGNFIRSDTNEKEGREQLSEQRKKTEISDNTSSDFVHYVDGGTRGNKENPVNGKQSYSESRFPDTALTMGTRASMRTKYNVKFHRKVNGKLECDKEGFTERQPEKRIRKITKGFKFGEKVNGLRVMKRESKEMRRSVSEGNLSDAKKSETAGIINREKCCSEDDVRGISKIQLGDTKNSGSDKGHRNAIRFFWNRLKKRNVKTKGILNQGSDEKQRGKLVKEEGQAREIEQENKPTLLMISRNWDLSSNEKQFLKNVDPGKFAHIQEEDRNEADKKATLNTTEVEELCPYHETTKNTSKREMKSGTRLVKLWETVDDNAVRRVKRIEESNQIGRKDANEAALANCIEKATKVGEASQVEETNQVTVANHIAEATQVPEVNHMGEANKMTDANHVRDANKEAGDNRAEEDTQALQASHVEKAAQDGQDSRVGDANRVEKVRRVRNGYTVWAVNQIVTANNVDEVTQTGKANETQEACQVQQFSNSDEDNKVAEQENKDSETSWTNGTHQVNWAPQIHDESRNEKTKTAGVTQIERENEVCKAVLVNKAIQTDKCVPSRETNGHKRRKRVKQTKGIDVRKNQGIKSTCDETYRENSLIVRGLSALPGYQLCTPIPLNVSWS